MMIVDRLLQERAEQGRPIGVGLVGAGFMARGLANQIVNRTPGMRLVAIANRDVARAHDAWAYAGVADAVAVDAAGGLEDAAAAGRPAVTGDPTVLCAAPAVDVLVEATGAVEFGARVTAAAIAARTHVVSLNAELDGTVGPILKVHADRSGVVLTAADGDQPGVQANLVRFVRGIGLEPLVCGNVKGLQDPYRTPATQAGFAARWGQNPTMVTSFADGTKIAFEQAVVANGTGFTVARRGMNGWNVSGHVDELVSRYHVDELRALGGIVDYVVGARPAPGVFVLAAHDDPKQRHYLELYKLGPGPLYSFYTPYHLCHFEVPNSIARAVLLGDAVLAPAAGPQVEVIATAKTDLEAGQVLDGLGGYHTYGQAERADVTAAEGALPMGVAEGCTLRREIPRDTVLRYEDVELPPGRLVDALRAEQALHFASAAGPDGSPAPADQRSSTRL